MAKNSDPKKILLWVFLTPIWIILFGMFLMSFQIWYGAIVMLTAIPCYVILLWWVTRPEIEQES